MKKCTCPTCGHAHDRTRKATDDAKQEQSSKRGLRGLREAAEALREDVAHERAERRMSKSYDAEERKEVRRKKTEEYGKGEVFAVPSLRSYPLTKDGKPSEERTMAAWRYLSMPKNAEKLGDKAGAARSRIRSFAKKHFGKELEGGEEAKKSMPTEAAEPALPTDEVYALQDRSLWPLTKGLQPDAALIQAAWQAVHSTRAQALLPDEDAAVAEARIAHFARHHKVSLPA